MDIRCTSLGHLAEQCLKQAYYVIIYSCWEEHIRERPMCEEHTDELLKKYQDRKWSCTDCNTKQYIAEIYVCLASEIKVDFLNI